VLIAASLWLLGCARCDAPATDAPAASATPDAGLDAGPPRAPVALPAGPWAEAESDELAAVRLATDHDAALLLRVAREHPDQAEAAIRALAHASDGELALLGLAEIARDAPARRSSALAALLALSRRPAMGVERLDPDGIRGCIALLHSMSRDGSWPAAQRALAVSALRGFARAGWLDPRTITTELDPSD
jgi:hypothetical protein